jgi:hypothetical protein
VLEATHIPCTALSTTGPDHARLAPKIWRDPLKLVHIVYIFTLGIEAPLAILAQLVNAVSEVAAWAGTSIPQPIFARLGPKTMRVSTGITLCTLVLEPKLARVHCAVLIRQTSNHQDSL